MTMMILISACSCVLGNTHATFFVHQNAKRIDLTKALGDVITSRSRFSSSDSSDEKLNNNDEDNIMIKPESLMDMDVIKILRHYSLRLSLYIAKMYHFE